MGYASAAGALVMEIGRSFGRARKLRDDLRE
jgi:hypothetical protein